MSTQPKERNENELLYKLGSLESTVQHLNDTFTSSFKRLEEKISDSSRYQGEKIDDLKIRVKLSEDRLESIEGWKDNIVIKLGFAASAISLFWVVFTEPIQHFFAGVF